MMKLCEIRELLKDVRAKKTSVDVAARWLYRGLPLGKESEELAKAVSPAKLPPTPVGAIRVA